MRCPKCNSEEKSSVIETRTDDYSIRRRRECISCTHRYSTSEQVELTFPIVVKKSGRRENFRSEKIRQGLIRSCQKRPVSLDDIDETVHDIERQVSELSTKEIPSEEVGNIVIAALKKLDKIAYLRFVSVYREFSSLEQFQETLKELEE